MTWNRAVSSVDGGWSQEFIYGPNLDVERVVKSEQTRHKAEIAGFSSLPPIPFWKKFENWLNNVSKLKKTRKGKVARGSDQ